MPSPSAPQLAYRPEVDGLRAIAIIPVVLYHAKVPGFPGGFVGVDVFFVISGYLITSIILKDIRLNTFSLASFYERRIRRIFPALFGMALCFGVAAALFFPPSKFSQYARSLVAMTVFGSNILFWKIRGPDGYFDRASDSEPLLHTWSLGVEEQFYLFFPIFLVSISRLSKQQQIIGLTTCIAASLLISAWGAFYKPVGTFYLLPTRGWELLIGSILATSFLPAPVNRLAREIFGLLGLVLIGWGVAFFSRDTPFPGLYALFPCFGTWLVLYSCTQDRSSSVKSILSLPLVVFAGLISYSLYLWHWPLLVLAKLLLGGALSAVETSAVLAASVVAACLSYWIIEAPFRGPRPWLSRQRLFVLAGLTSVGCIGIGVAIYATAGLPGRYDPRTNDLIVANETRKTEYPDLGPCNNFRTKIDKMSDISFCTLGIGQKSNILFWGDSHVQQLYPLIKDLHESESLGDHGVIFAIANGCPPAEGLNNTRLGYHCDTFAHFAFLRAKQEDVDTVFIGFSPWWFLLKDSVCLSLNGRCTRNISTEEALSQFVLELRGYIRDLRTRSKRVILGLPFIFWDKLIPDLEIRNAILGIDIGPSETSMSHVREQLTQAARDTGADIFDPRASLCVTTPCTYQLDGISIYSDNNHIASSQVTVLKENMLHLFSTNANPSPKNHAEERSWPSTRAAP